MEMDFERCYRAVDSRDQRFDGWFYTGVTSTGIYCRPSCPAITPKRQNVRFFPSAAAAQGAGLRACRRCRPDAAPGSPQWDVRADVVGRAMRLIADGVVDRDGVPGLASRLGYTERHLHRMLSAEMGAGPLALARAQRAQTARILIETTDLAMAEIAFAAGLRQRAAVQRHAPRGVRERPVRPAHGPWAPAGGGRGGDHRAPAGVPPAAARPGAAGLPRGAGVARRGGGSRRDVPPGSAVATRHRRGGADPGGRARGGDAAADRPARPGPRCGPLSPAARPGRGPGRRSTARSRRTRRWRRRSPPSPAFGCPARWTASKWPSAPSSANRSRSPQPKKTLTRLLAAHDPVDHEVDEADGDRTSRPTS